MGQNSIIPVAAEDLESLIAHWGEMHTLIKKQVLDVNNICIIGGAVVNLVGIRPNNDLDLCIHPHERESILQNHISPFEITSEGTIGFSEEVHALRGRYEKIGINDIDLFKEENFIRVGPFRFARPEIEFSYKVIRSRAQDISDVSHFEKYAANSPQWDWSLVRKLISAGNSFRQNPSLIASKRSVIQKIYQYGLLGSTRAVTRKLRASASQAKSHLRNLKKTKAFAQTCDLKKTELACQLSARLPTGALLSLQFEDGRFVRNDLFLRYLTAAAIDNGSHHWKETYQKMQRDRVNRDTYQNFCRLVESIRLNGLSSRYPVPIAENGRLLDGAHRLACAMYFGIPEIPVRIVSRDEVSQYGCLNKQGRISEYGRDWFDQHNFSADVLAQMESAGYRLFMQTGVWFSLILWPPVNRYFEEISHQVRNTYRIISESTIDLGEHFGSFVRDTYIIDDIEKWKVEVKLSAMQPYGSKIHFLVIEIPDPQFRAKNHPTTYLSCAGETLKKSLRNEFAHKIEDYFHDIICHTGDNHEHNSYIFNLFSKYQELVTNKL